VSIFKFVTEAGEKLGGAIYDKVHGEGTASEEVTKAISPEQMEQMRETAIKHRVGKLEGVIVQDFEANVKGDTAVITGKVADQATCDKITMAAGNQVGITSVDCQIEVLSPPAPEAPAAIYYEVQAGDTLGKIAKAHLGSSSKYMEIFEANTPMLTDPNKIFVGQTIIIPQ